ncbi:hypothetical protein Vretimale_9335 [Volvox reticuliferus]|nr:hypothetical protein Vretimale_9335 [Volvox reticuliferus]
MTSVLKAVFAAKEKFVLSAGALVNVSPLLAKMDNPFPLLVVPAILVAITLITTAFLLRFRKKAPVRKSIEAQRLGEPEVQGTVYVSDGEGHTVRRSTRPRKPIASPGYVPPSPARTKEKAEGMPTPDKGAGPATPRATRTTRSTAAAAATPVKDEQLPSPKIRSKRTPRV